MARVHTATKNKAGKEKKCGRCGSVIQPGQKYFHWSFRYGGSHVRCEKHYPRPSELTESKLSSAYSAREEIEDAQIQAGNDYDLDAMLEAMDSAKGTVEECKGEYEESISNMESAFPSGSSKIDEMQEKVDALEEFEDAIGELKDEIESEWNDLKGRKPEEPAGDDDDTEEWDIWTSEVQELIDRLGNLELNV